MKIQGSPVDHYTRLPVDSHNDYEIVFTGSTLDSLLIVCNKKTMGKKTKHHGIDGVAGT